MKLLHNNDKGHMPPLCDCVTVSRVTNGRDTIWPHHSSAALNPEQCHWPRSRSGFCEAHGKGQDYQIFVI